MRRRSLVLGGLCVLLLGGAIYFFVKAETPSTDKNVCINLINDIRKNDSNNSYKLFSSTTQKTMSKDDWKKTVTTLNQKYTGTDAPSLINRGDSIPSLSDPTIKQYSEIYKVATLGGTDNATCFIDQKGKSYTISAFTSIDSLYGIGG